MGKPADTRAATTEDVSITIVLAEPEIKKVIDIRCYFYTLLTKKGNNWLDNSCKPKRCGRKAKRHDLEMKAPNP